MDVDTSVRWCKVTNVSCVHLLVFRDAERATQIFKQTTHITFVLLYLDQFPYTHHMEAGVFLEVKRNNIVP